MLQLQAEHISMKAQGGITGAEDHCVAGCWRPRDEQSLTDSVTQHSDDLQSVNTERGHQQHHVHGLPLRLVAGSQRR